ncbi:centrosomal protein of 152 kDa-like [Watersipora subatra]|uniref:centrosomal protein of 152 kDa-like n=1 Tax=Watersipora subatra TaxID=2589382 RepID=UPI00355B972A
MATTESLIFDADRVQEEQEEELKQEEDERQQELKDLLANAFDDIEADETCSFASDDSHDSGRHSDEICQQSRWTSNKIDYHASTPVSECRAPPLITPVIHRRYSSSPSTLTAPHHSYNTKQGTETLYQEPDISSTAYEGSTGQKVDAGIGSPPYQTFPSQQGTERFNGSYPSSLSGSDSHQRHSSVQHSPLYQTCNGSADRHLTGSSDADNTVFVESGEKKTPVDILQERYFQEGPGAKNTQLGILYQAKSRQLQELQEKYELSQLENTKELRILRHEVALLQGSKQGCEASLKHTQALLAQNKEARFELQKMLDEVQDEKRKLSNECDELKEQLLAAEGSIESLNAQIFSLGSSDTIERMREQHESIVNSLRKEGENAKHELNQQIANLQQRLHCQKEEMDSATVLLKTDMEAIAKERVDHAETVNRLTQSLKESQRQVQDLLDQSRGAELSKLKIQLQQCTASKELTEQLCTSLQREVKELKEEILVHETTQTTQNIFGPPLAQDSDAYDDTLMELGLKSVPKAARCKSSKTTAKAEDTIQVLRQELQKYMSLVKEKREEIGSLRAEAGQRQQEAMRSHTEISVLRERLEKCQVQLKEACIELNLYKSAAGEGRSLSEVKLTRQMESLSNDKAILQDEVKCLTERLELVASNEAKLGEINAELNCKIGEMIEDFDRDKKAALERCQETLQSHNETVKDMMRAELETEYEMKVQRLDSRYQSDLSNAKSSCAALTEELRRVKELYVQVCSERRQNEEKQETEHSGDNSHLKFQQEKVVQLEENVSDLKSSKDALTGENERLSVMVTELKEQLAASKDNSKELSGRLSGLSACRELFSARQSRSTSLHSSSSNSEVDFQGQLQTAKAELSRAREELTIARDELTIAREELEKTQADEKISRNALETTQGRLAEAEQKLASSVQEAKKLMSEIQQLKVIIADLRGDNQKLDKLLSAERVQLCLTKDDVVTLQTQLSEYQAQFAADGKETNSISKVMGALEGCQKSLSKTQANLEAEVAAHSTTKVELEKLKDLLACETESHSQIKDKLSLAIADLQKERRVHLQTKSEIDKKSSLLQTELSNHSRCKIEVSKLRAENAEREANGKELVTRSELLKVETSLETEKSLHETTKNTVEELKRTITSEKAASHLIQTDLDKTSAALQTSRADHSNTKKKLTAVKEELIKLQEDKVSMAKAQSDLAEERRASDTLKHKVEELEKHAVEMNLQLSKVQEELDKVTVALQAEVAAHNEMKAEHDKLRNDLVGYETEREKLVEQSLLATVQIELEEERKAHQQTQKSLQKLENDSESERSFQMLTRSTLTNVQQQLQLERAEHRQTQAELAQIEEALQVEQTTHNATKIAVVTRETELSSERETQAELRRSLEKMRATYTEQEAELDLLRTNRNKDSEVITQMKSQRQQGKSQIETLKSAHAKSVAELNDVRAQLIKRESELKQKKATNGRLLKELDGLAQIHQEEKEKLVRQHADSLKRAVEEAETRWGKELSTPDPDVVAENKYLKEKLNTLELEVENCEKLLSQADEHFEKQLSRMRSQMQEEYTVQIEKLTSISNDTKNSLKSERAQQMAVKKDLEKQTADLRQQVDSLTQKSEDLENKCKDYQSCAEDLRRNLKSLSSQSDSLKAANKRLQAELKKAATSCEARVELLSKQLEHKNKELREGEHEHSLTVQSLKRKLVSLRNEQTAHQIAQRVAKDVESTSCACQTLPFELTGKHQYDIAVRSIRVEVMSYVEETNRNAAKLIRCEIHKAKQATARQLRNYYVKCFKQSLQDSRSSYAEKLNKLERTLDNAVAAAVTPTHVDTDSILSMPPEQLFTGSLRCSAHLDTCQDHSLAELYSRGPTPIVTDRPFRCSGRYVGRLTDVTPTPEDISDRETPVVTDTESRYSYVPLRNLAISSSFGPDRVASLASSICNTDSSTIIRELGLDNTETSPPRWYNPPPVKLTPSPDRQPCIDGKLQTMPLKTRPIETKE